MRSRAGQGCIPIPARAQQRKGLYSMLTKTGLMQRLKKHPETQELGLWLSRAELLQLLDKTPDKIGQRCDKTADLFQNTPAAPTGALVNGAS